MQQLKAMMLAILVLISLAALSEASCPSDMHVNGCSIPLGAPFPFKALFRPVCNRHDVCYICGHRYGWTRDQCDVAFKRDMERKCTATYSNRKRFINKIVNGIKGAAEVAYQIAKWGFVRGDLNRCKHGANIYYLAVKHFGKSFFQTSTPEWCKEQCARNAGDPGL